MKSHINMWSTFADGDDEVQRLIVSGPRVSGTEKRITWRAKGPNGVAINVLCEPKKGDTSRLIVQLTGHMTVEENDAARVKWAGIVRRFVASQA